MLNVIEIFMNLPGAAISHCLFGRAFATLSLIGEHPEKTGCEFFQHISTEDKVPSPELLGIDYQISSVLKSLIYFN